jgi:hypothetical protein
LFLSCTSLKNNLKNSSMGDKEGDKEGGWCRMGGGGEEEGMALSIIPEDNFTPPLQEVGTTLIIYS